MTKKVYVCGSFRYLDRMREAVSALRENGFDPTVSDPDDGQGIRGCFDKIRAADIVYVVNPGGTIGKSVCTDLGYAIALKKTIATMEPVDDPPLKPWISAVSEPERLQTALST